MTNNIAWTIALQVICSGTLVEKVSFIFKWYENGVLRLIVSRVGSVMYCGNETICFCA